MFFESHLKKRRSRLHFGAFLHLEGFQFGEKWIFTKILHTAGVLAFFGDLGGIKKSSKNQGNSPKNHGSEKAAFGDGFWTIFAAFFCKFQSAKHCKIQCFCNFCVERQQREMLQKHCKYRCFWRAMCRKHCKYRGFWRNVQKTSYVSRFFAFWLKSIGIYDVFWTPNAENCVNSMVLERFWTSGKQKLLVFTGFCECNAWKTLVFAGFSRVFFLWFYHCFASIDGSCMLTKRYLRARARAHARARATCIPFFDPFTLAASPVCEACQFCSIYSTGVKKWMILSNWES